MDVVAYFLALTNIQAIGGRSPDLSDASVKIADLGTLSNYLKNYPGFHVEDFKQDQVSHVGDVGMYISNNLRQFCLSGEGSAGDEGVILTFTYKQQGEINKNDEKVPNLAEFSFLFGKEGLSDDMVWLWYSLPPDTGDSQTVADFKTRVKEVFPLCHSCVTYLHNNDTRWKDSDDLLF